MSRNMLVHVPCVVRYYTENTRALIISAFELHFSPANPIINCYKLSTIFISFIHDALSSELCRKAVHYRETQV